MFVTESPKKLSSKVLCYSLEREHIWDQCAVVITYVFLFICVCVCVLLSIYVGKIVVLLIGFFHFEKNVLKTAVLFSVLEKSSTGNVHSRFRQCGDQLRQCHCLFFFSSVVVGALVCSKKEIHRINNKCHINKRLRQNVPPLPAHPPVNQSNPPLAP